MSVKAPFSHAFRSAFHRSLPVLFGYVPLGMAFGILFSELGFHWLYATVMSLIVFAGAGQFLTVGLLANHAGLLEIFVANLVLNLRHMVYGFSLLGDFAQHGLGQRLYLIFALTDETYSLLTHQSEEDQRHSPHQQAIRLWVSGLNHLYWVLGSTLGAMVGQHLPFSTAGIEFTLTALFLVLAMEQFRQHRYPLLVLLTVAVALSVTLWVSQTHMLMICITLALIVLALDFYRRK